MKFKCNGCALRCKAVLVLRDNAERIAAFQPPDDQYASGRSAEVDRAEAAISNDDSDDDPLAWLLLDQHTLTPEQAVYRQVCAEELEQLFRTLSAKDRAILGHTYGVFGYEKLSADELGLREMLSPDGVTKARKAALERLRSRYPGSGLHLWRDVYHALKDI